MMRAVAAVALALLASTPAAAQDRRWEIEFHGGVVAGTPASAGSQTLPPAGAPIVTSSPVFPSRETSSWLFGDGAALLNGVLADFGSTTRIVPLDALFAPSGGSNGGVFGVRVRRSINRRWSAEFGLDFQPSAGVDASRYNAAVEDARRSFASSFAALLATGPFSSPIVEATASSDTGSWREIDAIAAFNAEWGGWRSLVPYATVGGGINAGSGSLPSSTIRGSYHFSILGQVPVAETDEVSLRMERGTSFVAVAGGGVRRDLAGEWRLRIDARALIGPDTTRITVDAHPASVRGTPAGFIESFTNPAIQFSNDAATGRRSSLSGAPLDGFESFSGGLRARIVLSLAISRRF